MSLPSSHQGCKLLGIETRPLWAAKSVPHSQHSLFQSWWFWRHEGHCNHSPTPQLEKQTKSHKRFVLKAIWYLSMCIFPYIPKLVGALSKQWEALSARPPPRPRYRESHWLRRCWLVCTGRGWERRDRERWTFGGLSMLRWNTDFWVGLFWPGVAPRPRSSDGASPMQQETGVRESEVLVKNNIMLHSCSRGTKLTE